MPNPVAFLRSAGARGAGLGLVALSLSFPLVGEEPKHVSSNEALSQVITKVKPDYPEVAKQIRISGQVELEATIDEEGSVSSVKTLTGNPILAKAATDALRKWKFKPFKEDGRAMKVASSFTMEFKQ
jgi:TonB family protein